MRTKNVDMPWANEWTEKCEKKPWHRKRLKQRNRAGESVDGEEEQI